MFAATYDANYNHEAVNRSASRSVYGIFLLSDLSVLSNDPSQVTPILILCRHCAHLRKSCRISRFSMRF